MKMNEKKIINKKKLRQRKVCSSEQNGVAVSNDVVYIR